MIDSIRQYIGECPIFKGNKINVNYLGNKAKVSYSVEAVPSNPLIKKYTDGAKLCQVLFVVASRELYTESPKDNTAVMKFYDDFANWVDLQNKTRHLPPLPNNCLSQSLEVLTGPYLFDVGNNDARYQIQCRLTYYKEF